MSTRVVPVALLGAGKIGLGVLSSIERNAAHLARRWGLSFHLEAALDSQGGLLLGSSQTPQQGLVAAREWKSQGRPFASHPSLGASTQQVVAHLGSLAERGGVLVDCTASDTTPLLLDHLAHGGRVVLANKKPLSGALSAFKALTHASYRPRIGFESACGAGTPFITAVNRMVDSGDTVSRMSGCFSGTLGFITTQLSSATRMSELLSAASAAGFTEPDPRDDLSGVDVARKALILARLTGLDLEMRDVTVEPLYPQSLAACTAGEFLQRYSEVDGYYQQLALEAEKQDNTLRFVANVSTEGLQVGLRQVPQRSSLGALRGTDNYLEVWSRVYHKAPLVIQGSGAGVEITAAGVVADMVQVSCART